MADRPILLLEDDAETVEALVAFLNLEGFEVLAVGTLEEAEQQARRSPPGLLVLDLRIHRRRLQPNDVLRLRRIAYGCSVITMSASGKLDLEPSLYPSEGHLWKPFTLDELFQAVRRFYRSAVTGRVSLSMTGLGAEPLVAEVAAGVLWLSGELNEKIKVEQLQAAAPEGPTLRIDCAAIKRVNSFGVRTWMDYLDACEQRGVRVTLRALSPAMVAQCKLIRNFLSAAKVESFIGLFECTACNGETFELVETRTRTFPEPSCPRCGGTTQVPDDLTLYQPLFDAAP